MAKKETKQQQRVLHGLKPRRTNTPLVQKPVVIRKESGQQMN